MNNLTFATAKHENAEYKRKQADMNEAVMQTAKKGLFLLTLPH